MLGYLRFYTEYCDRSGITEIRDLVVRIRNYGYCGVLISDYFCLSGTSELVGFCIKNNVKPLVGCEVLVISDEGNKKFNGIVTIIAKNTIGYANICKLINKAWLRYNGCKGLYLKLSEIIKVKEIILLCNNIDGIFRQISSYGISCVVNMVKTMRRYNKNVYIEIIRNELKSEQCSNILLTVSKLSGVKVITCQTSSVFEDIGFNSLLVKESVVNQVPIVVSKTQVNLNGRINVNNKHMVVSMFRDIPSGLWNAIRITKECNYVIKKNEAMPYYNYCNDDRALLGKIKDTTKKVIREDKVEKSVWNRYIHRVSIEVKTIVSTGFSNYFLIVNDFITWARLHKILIGPGRGSGASSIIAYLLDITAVNPMDYGLFFERFLNARRRSVPDFDVDICKENRSKVIKYLRVRYGKYCVASIATIGRFAARNSIRDCARISGVNYNYVNDITKAIRLVGKDISVKRLLLGDMVLSRKVKGNDLLQNILRMVMLIEGKVRGLGVHAGGLVMVCANFYNFFPVFIVSEQKDLMVVQFDKKQLDKFGLVKFDLLGLNTLSILQDIIVRTGSKVTFRNVRLNDNRTVRLISYGNTAGVFQLENNKLKKYLRIIKPSRFNEIVNILALYRPGPIELLKRYYVKHVGVINTSVIGSMLNNIVGGTRGIIIFQEQIMEIVKLFFRYDLNDADVLRKDLSYGDEECVRKHREKIVQSVGRKYGNRIANVIFDMVKNFAGYSFNKAHAVSYAMITICMAYFKANYLITFYVSQLNYSVENRTRLGIIYQDMVRNGIKIMVPNINNAEYYFREINDNTITLGLIVIKSLKKNTIIKVVNERGYCKFKSVNDVVVRIKKLGLNLVVVRSVILSGLLRNFSGCNNWLLNYCNNVFKNGHSSGNSFNGKSDLYFRGKEKENLGLFLQCPFKMVYNIGLRNLTVRARLIFLLKVLDWIIKGYMLMIIEVNRFKVKRFIAKSVLVNNLGVRVNSFYYVEMVPYGVGGIVTMEITIIRSVK